MAKKLLWLWFDFPRSNFLFQDFFTSCSYLIHEQVKILSVCGFISQYCHFVFLSFVFPYFSTLCLETANLYLIHEAAKEADEAPGRPCNRSTHHLNGNDHHEHDYNDKSLLLIIILVNYYYDFPMPITLMRPNSVSTTEVEITENS